MKVLLYVYLGISILTFVLYNLKAGIVAKNIRNKYGNRFDGKLSFSSKIFAYLKTIVVSFMPLINVVLLIVILFFENKIDEATKEMVSKALENDDLKEKF